jgi:hypothetical protein
MMSKYSDMKGALSVSHSSIRVLLLTLNIQQTLAPLAINSSTSFYKLRLDPTVLQLINIASFTHLTVEQTCLEFQPSSNATIMTPTYGTSKLNAGDDRVYSVRHHFFIIDLNKAYHNIVGHGSGLQFELQSRRLLQSRLMHYAK